MASLDLSLSPPGFEEGQSVEQLAKAEMLVRPHVTPGATREVAKGGQPVERV